MRERVAGRHNDPPYNVLTPILEAIAFVIII